MQKITDVLLQWPFSFCLNNSEEIYILRKNNLKNDSKKEKAIVISSKMCRNNLSFSVCYSFIYFVQNMCTIFSEVIHSIVRFVSITEEEMKPRFPGFTIESFISQSLSVIFWWKNVKDTMRLHWSFSFLENDVRNS